MSSQPIHIPGSLITEGHDNESDQINPDDLNQYRAKHVPMKTENSFDISEDIDNHDENEDDEEKKGIDEFGSQVETDSLASTNLETHINGKPKVDKTPPELLLKKSMTNASVNAQLGKNQESLNDLIRCCALARIVYGPNHWRFAETCANLAQGYLDLKGTNFCLQAEEHGEVSKRILLSNQGNPTSEKDRLEFLKTSIVTYHTLARALALLKKYKDAESNIIDALKVHAEIYKLSSVNENYIIKTAIKLHSSASKISSRLEKHAVAMTHLEEALEIAEPFYTESKIELIPIYQGLGQAEQNKDKANHEKAIEYYTKAHTIATVHYNKNSSEVADSARALAMAYSKSKDPQAETSSESYMNDALSIYLSIYGPNHTSVINTQSDLARLFLRTNRQEEGLRLLRRNLQCITEVHGEFSDEALDTHKLIGSTLLAQGSMEGALKEFKKCLQIEELKYGSNSKKLNGTKTIVDTIMANPAIAQKQGGSDLKSRPRFSNVVSKSKPQNIQSVFS